MAEYEQNLDKYNISQNVIAQIMTPRVILLLRLSFNYLAELELYSLLIIANLSAL